MTLRRVALTVLMGAIASCATHGVPPPDTLVPGRDPVRLLSQDDLRARGLTVEVIDAEHSLVCGRDRDACACLRTFSPAGGPHPTYAENVDVFWNAVRHGQAGRTVVCEMAETGVCGPLRYFTFVGDVHRNETRWFGADGQLVGESNVTDYAACCDGRASFEWSGDIPVCDAPRRSRLLCGQSMRGNGVRPPLDEIVGTVAPDEPPVKSE